MLQHHQNVLQHLILRPYVGTEWSVFLDKVPTQTGPSCPLLTMYCLLGAEANRSALAIWDTHGFKTCEVGLTEVLV